MKKRIFALLLIISMLFAVASCSTEDAVEKSITKENIKIGVIHIGDPADKSGYSYAHDQGIVAMQQELGLKDEQIVRKTDVADGDTSAVKTAIEDCIAQGCNMIFGTSFGYMGPMKDLAEQYKDVIFSHASGFESNDTNFNNYFGRIYQARYLSGIAAGLKAAELDSTQIGYVSAFGTTMAETSSGINAFALGVQSVNADAVVNVKVLNSWYDPAKETSNAEALLEMGCSVIAQHCDTPNPQLAAQRAGKFGCGYNSDMTNDAKDAHLTAPIWNWGVYYTKAAKAAIDGKWKEFGNYYEGIKEGFVDISQLTDNCAPATKDYIDQVRNLFKEGSWDVFSGVKLSFDVEGNLVKTDADIIDQNGNVIVASGGASVADSVITGSMNYYVKGVEGDLK